MIACNFIKFELVSNSYIYFLFVYQENLKFGVYFGCIYVAYFAKKNIRINYCKLFHGFLQPG